MVSATRARASLDQLGEAPGELAFGLGGELAIDEVGDDEAQHAVAQELQPLIGRMAGGAAMGQGLVEELGSGEDVADRRARSSGKGTAESLHRSDELHEVEQPP